MRKREPWIPHVGEGRPAGRVDPIAVDECRPSADAASAEPTGYDDVARRYRTLVEQLPLVVYVDALDEASSNIFTSPQVESLLGYTPAEWLAASDLFVRLRCIRTIATACSRLTRAPTRRTTR